MRVDFIFSTLVQGICFSRCIVMTLLIIGICLFGFGFAALVLWLLGWLVRKKRGPAKQATSSSNSSQAL